MKSIIHYLWQIFSNILVLYGFYLIYLFFYDTFLRIMENEAKLIAIILTIAGFLVYITFQLRKFIPFMRSKKYQ